jgi:hypothetical protein
MPEYRLYCLEGEKHISEGERIEAQSDEEALRSAHLPRCELGTLGSEPVCGADSRSSGPCLKGSNGWKADISLIRFSNGSALSILPLTLAMLLIGAWIRSRGRQ